MVEDFSNSLRRLEESGYVFNQDLFRTSVPDSRENLLSALKVSVSNPKWLPEYEEVAAWLSDNEGKGILLMGNCGRGKSEIGYKAIPILLHHFQKKLVKCYNASELNTKVSDILTRYLVYIDDVGVEDIANNYGEKRCCFADIVDNAEKKGVCLMLSTNLSIDQMREKYGERTMDRLRKITKLVIFRGNSMRR